MVTVVVSRWPVPAYFTPLLVVFGGLPPQLPCHVYSHPPPSPLPGQPEQDAMMHLTVASNPMCA